MSSQLRTCPGLSQPAVPTRSAASWRSSWASALRLARRDIRKHKGRSLLVVLLVGLPVLAIAFAASAYSTVSVSQTEALPRQMGTAQASIVDPGTPTQAVTQYVDGTVTGPAGPAKRQTGYRPRSAWTPQRVERLTGGVARERVDVHAEVALGDRRIEANVVGIDGASPAAPGIVRLLSGRWPRSSHEVVVGPTLRSEGVPASGALTVRTQAGRSIRVTAVGEAAGYTTSTTPADLVMLPALATHLGRGETTTFLVSRSAPFSWSEVKRLNAYGVAVRSRIVLTHPAQAGGTAAEPSDGNHLGAEIAILIAMGMVLETTLLAGPAFAVGAARQRRTFALIASNGAVAGQLRRFVLAQAMLLGVGAAVVGGALGTLIGAFGVTFWASRSPQNVIGPPDAAWQQLAGIVLVAAIASLVAAYLPSRGVTRIDLIAALRGHGVTGRRVRAGWPLVGLALAVVGGAVTASTISGQGHETNTALGAVLMFAGALFTIPWILFRVGALTTWLPLPVPLRLAIRDVGRQRGRSVPAVAAIMASVTTLTALAIGGFSDQAQARAEYQPITVMGQGLINGDGANWSAAPAALVHKVAPQLLIGSSVTVGYSGSAESPKHLMIRAVPSACSQAEVLSGRRSDGPCSTLSVDAFDAFDSPIAAVDFSVPPKTVDLSPDDLAFLRTGGVLTTKPRVVHNGKIVLLDGPVAGRGGDSGPGARMSLRARHVLPARVVSTATLRAAYPDTGTAAVLAWSTAQRLGWPTYVSALRLKAPHGSISRATQTAINQRLKGSSLIVERGYQYDSFWVFALLFAVFGLLVLIGTLISTALAQAEARPNLGTLAAVGAPATLRRTVAGAQAFTVGVIGGLLGLAVGMVPGIAVTWPLTVTQNFVDGHNVQTGPYIDIPWLPLAAVILAVPLLAGLLAAASIRRTPPMTRRAE